MATASAEGAQCSSAASLCLPQTDSPRGDLLVPAPAVTLPVSVLVAIVDMVGFYRTTLAPTAHPVSAPHRQRSSLLCRDMPPGLRDL